MWIWIKVLQDFQVFMLMKATKKSSYPILSENPENIVSVDFNGIMDNDTHIVFHDDELKKKFVETYKKELMNLDYETKLKSYPLHL